MNGDGRCQQCVLLICGLEVPWEAGAHCYWTERCIAETFCPKEQENAVKRAHVGSRLWLQGPR